MSVDLDFETPAACAKSSGQGEVARVNNVVYPDGAISAVFIESLDRFPSIC